MTVNWLTYIIVGIWIRGNYLIGNAVCDRFNRWYISLWKEWNFVSLKWFHWITIAIVCRDGVINDYDDRFSGGLRSPSEAVRTAPKMRSVVKEAKFGNTRLLWRRRRRRPSVIIRYLIHLCWMQQPIVGGELWIIIIINYYYHYKYYKWPMWWLWDDDASRMVWYVIYGCTHSRFYRAHKSLSLPNLIHSIH